MLTFLEGSVAKHVVNSFFFSFSARLNSIYFFYHIITQLTDEKLGPNSGFYHLHTWADIRVCFITMY